MGIFLLELLFLASHLLFKIIRNLSVIISPSLYNCQGVKIVTSILKNLEVENRITSLIIIMINNFMPILSQIFSQVKHFSYNIKYGFSHP